MSCLDLAACYVDVGVLTRSCGGDVNVTACIDMAAGLLYNTEAVAPEINPLNVKLLNTSADTSISMVSPDSIRIFPLPSSIEK